MYMNLHYQYQNSQQYRKGPVTWGDLSPLQNHLHDTKCDLTLRHVACDTPVLLNGTGNKLMIKMASQGRPVIGLFTELSQRGDGMCMGHFVTATCPMNSNWFEFMRHMAATCHSVKLHKNILVTQGDLSRGCAAETGRLMWQDLKYEKFRIYCRFGLTIKHGKDLLRYCGSYLVIHKINKRDNLPNYWEKYSSTAQKVHHDEHLLLK